MAITVTDTAVAKIAALKRQRQQPEAILRLGLQGGGCSGFMYFFDFVDTPEENDKIFQFDDVTICIDIKSYLFLNGMEIDYEESLLKSGLVFNNPNATRSCGCGESISF